MQHIRPARPDEAAEISALALRSKAHWDYTQDQLDVFRAELTVTPAEISKNRAHVLEADGRVLGFYTLTWRAEREIELEHLFIEPTALRRGAGAALLRHACDLARADGATHMMIQSDPNAAGFYAGQGGEKVADIPSSIPGRTLPEFRLRLDR